jgi:hypothetical protein
MRLGRLYRPVQEATLYWVLPPQDEEFGKPMVNPNPEPIASFDFSSVGDAKETEDDRSAQVASPIFEA